MINSSEQPSAIEGITSDGLSYEEPQMDDNKPSEETMPAGSPADVVDPPMSKNARKKLARQLAYEASRPERLRKNKEKKIAKREAYRTALAEGTITKAPPSKPKGPQKKSTLKVIIDCSFDELMADREIKSMCSQLTRCYSENRSARHPCDLIITSFNDKIAERFKTVFKSQHESWHGVQIVEQEYIDADGHIGLEGIDVNDLVYLSADSENTIDEIDETKAYIIGGIVDKNRYKNLCQEKAVRQGIKTARLPIGDYIQMASRKVLTVNHVFEIMSRWLE